MNNLIDILKKYIFEIFKALALEKYAGPKNLEILIDRIYREAFTELIAKKIPKEKQDGFTKEFVQAIDKDRTKFLDLASQMGSEEETRKTILEQTNIILAEIINTLYKDGDISEENIKKLEDLLKNPVALEEIEKLTPKNLNNIKSLEDVLQI